MHTLDLSRISFLSFFQKTPSMPCNLQCLIQPTKTPVVIKQNYSITVPLFFVKVKHVV